MITIYHDFQKHFQGETDPSTAVAQRIQDYIPLRQFLRRALDDPDHAFLVYLQHRVLAEWLRDLHAYPEGLLRWEDFLPASSPSSGVSIDTMSVAGSIETRQPLPDLPAGEDSIKRVNVLPPLVTIEGFLLPGRETTSKVIVTNPNPVSLWTVQLQVDCAQSVIEWNALDPDISQSKEIQFFIQKTKATNYTLIWTLRCESEGQQWQFDNYVEMPVRQFQTNDVDAMFEEML